MSSHRPAPAKGETTLNLSGMFGVMSLPIRCKRDPLRAGEHAPMIPSFGTDGKPLGIGT
jgi:hypothetical protein